jgi:twitching motility two-component system response regulator PilG
VKKKILVVDDNASILELETSMLRLLGYEPLGAASGMAALKLLAQETPALALLDVALPDMDGFKICQHIKNQPATTHIPVFLVSAKKSGEDLERGEKAGADEYVAKPFRTADIAELIERYLGVPE